MILLDTNVISALMRSVPEQSVRAWIRRQPAASLFLSATTEAELRYGVAIMPEGGRRDRLQTQIDAMLDEDFRGRILPFDSAAAGPFAEIAAARRVAGRPIGQFDCQIAAIARSRSAILATRNVSDFSDCGVAIINPWAGGSPI